MGIKNYCCGNNPRKIIRGNEWTNAIIKICQQLILVLSWQSYYITK